MLRLTGILTGSALAIAALLFFLGTPQLSDSGSVTHPQGSGSVSDPPGTTQVIDSADPMVLESPDSSLVTDPEPDPEPSRVTDPEPRDALIEQLFAPEDSRELVLPVEPEAMTEERWYAFWSPFRSEIAANGFVAKLQESTGIDYRVVKVKTGVYEVAFSYTDDADIETKLERIASATGLELSGS